MDEQIYNLWFAGLKIKPALKIHMLAEGYTPYKLFQMDERAYLSLGANLKEIQEIKNSDNIKSYDECCEYINKEEIRIILYNDNQYPELLRNIYDPPAALFVKGAYQVMDDCLAVVGARRASDYGKTVAYKLAMELAVRGVTVASGLARGIDSCAHQGSLDGEGCTVAVMGSGFKHIYPPQNKKLFEAICSTGCAITEYMPDIPPYAGNFPKRNRIISGISKGIIIVEAGEKSGSLITARLALDQGRDVFAVPGNIFSPLSKGTNSLIKDGAKPVTCAADVLEEYGIIAADMKSSGLDEDEKEIYKLIENGAATLETLSEALPFMKVGDILALLSRMECKGSVKRMYGGYYIS